MSDGITELMQSIDPKTISALSQQLGLDEAQTQQAVGAALPMLLGQLARNSETPQGAQSLLGALERDHDGSALDDVAGFLGSDPSVDGAAILGHIFGSREPAVERTVEQTAGLDPQTVMKLMTLLAPLVMAYLGKQRKAQDLSAEDLSSMLGKERSRLETDDAGQPSIFGQVATQILDADGDGDVTEEVIGMGAGLLGKLLGGR